ncbi:MAG: molybdopterin-dependent oxidoreductase, partial [Chloroflexi bacterium]|nr:molybdopterin-dependent oxidoreductase [Chloroflexota bacterium]
MTNHWIDIRNSDCIMIIGSNAAENHPISFKWVGVAMGRGAKLISVDPRFTRTSAEADIYCRIRSGTDIAFIGGMIRHVLEDMRKSPENYNIDYVTQYTNAAYKINTGVKLPG